MKRHVWIACAAAVWGGGLAYAFMSREGFTGDFLAFWFAARAWVSGADPYAVTPAAWGVYDRFFYPFPALVVMAPFAVFPRAVAGALFFGLSSGLLGYALARDGWHRLTLIVSFPFIMAASMGQWSALVTAAVLLPGLGFLAVCKPNLAAAFAVWRPSISLIVGGGVFLAATLLLDPQWPYKWVLNVQTLPGHPPMILTPWGAPAALAALRWRRPEARLLLGLACVPSLPMFADQLAFLLIPATRVEAMIAAILSHAGGITWIARGTGAIPPLTSPPYVAASVLWPAVVMVLRRPNVAERRPEAGKFGQ